MEPESAPLVGCETLLAVPTPLERKCLERHLLDRHEPLRQAALEGRHRWIGCGAGPVVSGITLGHALATYRPRRVLLLGIAGGFAGRCEIGEAWVADSFALDGVGAWHERRVLPPAELSWSMYEPTGANDPSWELESPIVAAPWLSLPSNANAPARLAGSLTVCAAAGSADQAAERAERHPTCVAEEMEGFAAAVACRCHDVPFTMVRGVSNTAGYRDFARWEIEPALASVARLVAEALLESAMVE
ncbi:MAG: futalosine hydrolase [Pirellulaceae bacterium]